MRIAISTDGENVSPHFGRCPTFTIADIEQGNVVSKQEVPNPGHQPGVNPCKHLFSCPAEASKRAARRG